MRKAFDLRKGKRVIMILDYNLILRFFPSLPTIEALRKKAIVAVAR
jgi:hypothetical protein